MTFHAVNPYPYIRLMHGGQVNQGHYLFLKEGRCDSALAAAVFSLFVECESRRTLEAADAALLLVTLVRDIITL